MTEMTEYNENKHILSIYICIIPIWAELKKKRYKFDQIKMLKPKHTSQQLLLYRSEWKVVFWMYAFIII